MQFAYKPSVAWVYAFLIFLFEITLKNYVEWWVQTFGTPDFDIRARSVPASGSGSGSGSEFITPMDPSGVVTSGWKVKNCTGYCYRGIFIMDKMGSYVPNTSRRVLGFFLFFLFVVGKPLPSSCRAFFLFEDVRFFLMFCSTIFFLILIFGVIFYFKA